MVSQYLLSLVGTRRDRAPRGSRIPQYLTHHVSSVVLPLKTVRISLLVVEELLTERQAGPKGRALFTGGPHRVNPYRTDVQAQSFTSLSNNRSHGRSALYLSRTR